MRRTLAHLMAIVLVANGLVSHATAAGLPAGDIVVTAEISNGDQGLIEINPITGNRTILSDNTHGTGMPFSYPIGISFLPNGDLLVADGGALDQLIYPQDNFAPPPPGSPARLYIVDPTTGDRTVISQDALTSVIPPYPTYPQIGSGPAFGAAAFARQVGNRILVSAADNEPGAPARLMSVDPATGNRSLISAGGVGTGPDPLFPGDMLVSGNTAFVPSALQGLFTVDLTTGNRVNISGPNAGSGPAFGNAFATEPYGDQLLVVGAGSLSNSSSYGVFRIDPATGNRTLISSSTIGGVSLAGGEFIGMAIESGGTILLNVWNGLLTFDPLTGNGSRFSDATHGSGASFLALHDVAVVPLAGDANGDGITNSQDLATISSQWNHSGYFLAGDLNGDGIVNTEDLTLVSSNWLGASLTHGGAIGNQSAAVPEPSAIILAAIAGLSLLTARPKKWTCWSCAPTASDIP
jgi:hypothetical protein